jgi:hypothetical protein
MKDVDTSLARLVAQLEEADSPEEVDLISTKIAVVQDMRATK